MNVKKKIITLGVASFIVARAAVAQNIPPESEWNVEKPQEPTEIQAAYPAVCADGVTVPTCSPVNDWLCWNWCDMVTVSVGDVYHWKGAKWKDNWAACGVDLKQWVAYAESLQKQIGKCKKWGK